MSVYYIHTHEKNSWKKSSNNSIYVFFWGMGFQEILIFLKFSDFKLYTQKNIIPFWENELYNPLVSLTMCLKS